MITTGIIREKALDKGSFVGNAYRVELNIFQIPGDNEKVNYTYIANCSTLGGIYDSYDVGDVVYVGFLNNNKSLPIILGKIYQGLQDAARSFANLNALSVSNNANLPANTKIGEIDFSDKKYFFDNVNEVIKDKNIFIDSAQFKSFNEGAGLVHFNDSEGVLEVSLSPKVTIALGIDTVEKVYNDTDEMLVDGQVVYVTNNNIVTSPVALAIGSNYLQAEKVRGVVTEPIDIHSYGFITKRGFVSELVINPDIYNVNDTLYLSSTVVGGFTNERPVPPNFITKIGYVSKVSSNSITADGQIYVDIVSVPVAVDINYDNEYITDVEHRLNSKSTQGAIDELQLNKADISMLSSNITLYRTLVNSDVVGPLGDTYRKLVTSTSDLQFPPGPTAVTTPEITTTGQYIAGAIAPAGIFVGNPGQVNIFSIGKVKKLSGNNNQNAEFYFELYKRTGAGVETLIATSATTGVVSSTSTWLVFNATALMNSGELISTDSLVVKSYANVVGNPGGVFQYEFGGDNPFRLLIPVPVSVIPTAVASAIFTDTTNFDKILSHLDINVQKALETIDVHTHVLPTASATVAGVIKVGEGLIVTEGVLSSTSPIFNLQTKKTFLAAPNAIDGVPTFREIIAADIPVLNQSTTGNADTATKLATARTFTITDNDATNSQASATNFDGSNNFTIKLPSTIKATITGIASGNLTSASTLDASKLSGAIPAAVTQTEWDAAYGWGDHSGLYRPIAWVPSASDISGLDATHRWLTDTYITTWNSKQDALTNPVTGTGTADELVYWTASGTIGSLTSSTYPSKTELSYLKGATSAIQAQLNGKEPVISSKLTAFNKNYGTTAADVKVNGTQSVGSVDAVARIDHVHPTDTSRVAANTAITGATKTKITYDSKGLVTAGADASLADLSDVYFDAPPVVGNLLRYNGEEWAPANASGTYAGPTETFLGSRTSSSGTTALSNNIDNFDEIVVELEDEDLSSNLEISRMTAPISTKFNSVDKCLKHSLFSSFSNAFVHVKVSRNVAGTTLTLAFSGTGGNVTTCNIYGRNW